MSGEMVLGRGRVGLIGFWLGCEGSASSPGGGNGESRSDKRGGRFNALGGENGNMVNSVL